MGGVDHSALNANAALPDVLAVRLSAQFVNRFCARLEKGAESSHSVAGLLFGLGGESRIIVQAFKSLALPEVRPDGQLDEEALNRIVEQLSEGAKSDPEISAFELVGWYRVRASGGLRDEEVLLHNAGFPQPAQIALIAKREDGDSLVLEFYAGANGSPLSAEAHRWGALRLPMRTAAAGSIEVAMQTTQHVATAAEDSQPFADPTRPTVTRVPTPAATPGPKPGRSGSLSILPERQPLHAGLQISAGPPPSVPALRPREPQPRRRVPWVSSLIVCGVMAAATFAFLFFTGLPTESSVPSFLRGLLPESGLMLHIEGQGDRVLLSWNRRNAVVRTAIDGVLHIDDGTQHREVQLDAGQVANGLVLYRPSSNDVTFRLEIHGPQGAPLSETVRVLDSTRGEPLDLSANAAADVPSGADIASRTTMRRPQRVSVPAHLESAAGRSASERSNGSQLRTVPPILVGTNGEVAGSSRQAEAAGREGGEAATPMAIPPAAAPTAPSTSTSKASPSASGDETGSRPAVPAGVPANQEQPPAASHLPLGSPAEHATSRFVPPRPTHQVLPDTTRIPAEMLAAFPQVGIVVDIDKNGNVTDARVVSGRNIKPALAELALAAAKQWRFQPATDGGQAVESKHTVLFQFQPADR